MAEHDIDPEILRRLLDYNPETGALIWKERPLSMFRTEGIGRYWNRRNAGKPALAAGHGGENSYLHGHLLGRVVKAHRIIWAIATGESPDEVDHINGCRSDNRLSNLRNVTHAENGRNQRRHTSNSSGVLGVTWRQDGNRWRVRIRVDGKAKHIGDFRSLEDAAEARAAANVKYGYHPNHGQS